MLLGGKAGNFWFYTLATSVNILSSYTILYVLTTYLSKADYAQFGLYNSIFSLLLVVFNFGVKEATFKLSSTAENNRLDEVLSHFSRWQLLLTVCVFLIGVWYFQVALIALSFLATTWLLVLAAWHRGQRHYLKDAVSLPLQRILWLLVLGVILFLSSDISYVHVFFASFIATMIVIPVLWQPVFEGQYHKKLKVPEVLWKFLFIEAAILTYTRVDVLILKAFNISATEIADYYFSVQIFDAAVLLLAPISYFFFNRMSTALKSTRSDYKRIAISYMLILLSLVFIGQLIWYLVGDYFLSMFFELYTTAGGSISLFLWALYPLVINFVLSGYLILNNAEKTYATICAMGLLFYLLTSYKLVPILGTTGSIYSRTGTEWLLMVLMSLAALMTWRRNVSRDNL